MTGDRGDWIDPTRDMGWPDRVGALVTTRRGGSSPPPREELDLGGGRDDRGRLPADVIRNRGALRASIGGMPICFLRQVHGTGVHRLERSADAQTPEGAEPEADAAVVRCCGVAACVLAADCLPVLLADRAGTVVAAAHAGWRGLAAGVLERTLEAMAVPATELSAWLGPCIGPGAFEVGPEVRAAFRAADPEAVAGFRPGRPGRWHGDLALLARQRLARAGVGQIGSAGIDVHADASRFYSHRRDAGRTGRQAALIWLNPRPRS
jgi:YfiH family protein